ncbi:MAG: hypothetical protein BWK78_01265 [Thiotrichaceae bacterium IS1]|nr:MAG: hypothetical protein BWK78_01265 [Thiotrichaceae bacterium IS1]
MHRDEDWSKISFVTDRYQPAVASRILKRVRERGSLTCGGRTDLAGFGFICPNGQNCGFDTDLCKAVAAAALNSPAAPIKFVSVDTPGRKPALVNDEVDILSRNTTWTSLREAEWGNFTWIMFYDGQGFMVRKDSGVTSLQQVCAESICVAPQTTTYMNLADTCRKLNLQPQIVEVPETDEAFTIYENGGCRVITTDKSGLATRKVSLSDPNAHTVLDVTISKEPLTPSVPKGDELWTDIVRTVMWGLINAEELGITQANVDTMLTSTDPQVKRLLGVEGDFGQKSLGLEPGAIAQAIRAVGNYGELYNRYLGPSGVDIPRGPNKLWSDGGQIYAPPLR